jgi:DNA repair exonuclease SbcCD ATPase subunit
MSADVMQGTNNTITIATHDDRILADLEQKIAELVEAQKRTEEELRRLSEAQARTEEELKKLSEAQRRTEARVDTLEQKMTELAEAQKRTEARMETLEQKMAELAEAQKRTEEELKKLTREHIKTRENLGGLQHTVGYILEDRAYRGLPALLERDFGVKLLQPLRREYIEIAPGKYVEANIIGLAQKNGKKVWIIGECKSQLKKRHINDFLKDVDRLKKVLAEEMILIAVTYQTPPPIQEYIKEKGIKLYFSYEFPLV